MLLLANYMPSPLYIQNDKKEKYIRDFFYLFDPLINEFIEDIVLVNVKLFLEPSISNNKRKFFTFIIEFNYKLSKTEKMIDFVIESIDCPSANIFFFNYPILSTISYAIDGSDIVIPTIKNFHRKLITSFKKFKSFKVCIKRTNKQTKMVSFKVTVIKYK